jgi:membrane dipeptidase
MLIFDGDYPMAYGAMDLNRDLTLPIERVRAVETKPGNLAMACLPEMRKGGIAAALVKVVARIERAHNPLRGYRSPACAYGAAQGQLAYYRMLAAQGEAAILTTREEFARHFETWQNASETDALPVGFVLGMEGADPILWPDQVESWWADGIRVVSLTHYGVSTYAHGTGTPGGLLPDAGPLLREMEEIGMILDLTHIADESFWEAEELFNGPVLASHQNCRALVPGERQFTDEQLRVIIERGGVIGASMDSWMLYPPGNLNWADTSAMDRRSRFPREAVTLEDFVNHIDHVCQLAGNARHAAIGGDTDGQGGVDGAPHGVDTVADYQKVAGILTQRGYTAEDVENILYRNWQRFFEQWLPA